MKARVGMNQEGHSTPDFALFHPAGRKQIDADNRFYFERLQRDGFKKDIPAEYEILEPKAFGTDTPLEGSKNGELTFPVRPDFKIGISYKENTYNTKLLS